MPIKLTRANEWIEQGDVIKGRWELDADHQIRYRAEAKDEQIKLKAPLFAVEAGALLIAVTEKQADQNIVTSIVTLSGRWRLDSKNRITFEVQRQNAKTDTLTFTGGWQVSRGHEIIYSYEEISLKTKTKEIRTLVFKGFWDITQRNRLVYSIGGDSNSYFNFRGAFQTKSVFASEGEIRYEAGVETAGRRLPDRLAGQIKTITLFGKWKISRNLGLSFEIEYEGGRKKSILFGGEYTLDKTSRVAINIKNEEGRPLGLELILTKDFFKNDGQAFIRLQKSIAESRVEAGVRFRW